VEEATVLPDLASVLTEIELDNALINRPASSAALQLSQDTASLGDSGSSNSSLLGKIEDCMRTVKEESNDIQKPLNESQRSNPKKIQESDTNMTEAVKLDLRPTEKVRY